MKKVLIGTTALSLLLAGCGQGEEQKKEETKSVEVKTEEKEQFVSDKEVNEKIQKYVDVVMTEFTQVQISSESGNIDNMAGNYPVSGNNILKAGQEVVGYLNEVKEPIKYTKPVEDFKKMADVMGKYIVDVGQIANDSKEGKINTEEAGQKVEDLTNELDKNTVIESNGMNGLEKLKNFGVKTDELEKLFNEENGSTTTESSTNEENSSNEDSEERQTKIVNTVQPNIVINAGPAQLTISKVELGEVEVTEDNSYDFPDLKVGDKAQLVFVYMDLKNTVDQDTTYYADQAIITTDTGEQLEPMMVMEDDGITAEMKGDVESSGRVIYQLKNSTVNDLNSITFIAPSYNDPETMDEITPEQKIEIPVK